MYDFKDSTIKKEFFLERFEQRLEFRRKFKFFVLFLLVFWILNDLLFALDSTFTWLYFALRTVAALMVAGIYVKITQHKYFSDLTAGNRIYYVDFFIFFPLLALQTILTGVSSTQGVELSETDGIKGYFFALDMAFNFMWPLLLSEFLITNWLFRVSYFGTYWAILLVLKAIHLPTAAGLFLNVRVFAYFIIIVVFQERSSRLNFDIKRAHRNKIEMFESILKRIQEQIVVFNRKMEVKYSNISPKNLSDEFPTPRDNLSPECILSNITSLRLLTGSILNTNFAKLFEEQSNQTLNLTQCLDKIAKTQEFYDELGARNFIQIEGKSSEVPCSNKIPLGSETRYFTLQLFTNCLHDEECIVVIIKDITHHISMLQEKNDLQTNLLNSLSHELKTPLGISLGLVEKAVEDHKTPLELSKTYLVPALSYGKMLTFFINDVLDFIKIQKNEFQLNPDYFCVENLLDEIIKLFDISFKRKDISFKLDYDESVRTLISSDPERLKQVLVNLLSNAIKYTMQGTVTLGFTHSEDSSAFSFFIKDTGIGIRKDELEILNTKLESINFVATVNANSTGAGIGLITANALVKRLNPSKNLGLFIESQSGVGSKFSFIVENVPQASNRLNTSFEFGAEVHSPQRKARNAFVSSFKSSEDLFSLHSGILLRKMKNNKQDSMRSDELRLEELELPCQSQDLGCACKRILVIDDEVFNTVAAEMICKAFGFTVDCAFNGKQALNLIQRRNDASCCSDCRPYELVIMDCNMPVMDGYQATRRIREMIQAGTWKDMIIVGCTAYEGRDKLEECLRSGMNTYVKKPLDRNKFAQLLGRFNI